MTRVLVVSSSPRKGANSQILAETAAAGAIEAGAEVEQVSLASLSIAPCRACEACQGTPGTPCVIRDDMQALLPKLRACDAMVLASPVYFFTISSQLKLFLDRWYALGGGGDWTAMKGKRAALALTYGGGLLDSGVLNALGMFRDAFEFLGIEHVGTVHASCNAAGEIRDNAEALASARELGRQLARPR